MADLHSSSFLTLTPRRSSFHSLSGMHGSVHSRLKGSETWDLCQQFLSGKSPNLCIIIIFSAVLQPLAKILDLQSNCFVSVSSLSKWRRPPQGTLTCHAQSLGPRGLEVPTCRGARAQGMCRRARIDPCLSPRLPLQPNRLESQTPKSDGSERPPKAREGCRICAFITRSLNRRSWIACLYV